MTREEQITAAEEIVKKARKGATPEHIRQLDEQLNWFQHEREMSDLPRESGLETKGWGL